MRSVSAAERLESFEHLVRDLEAGSDVSSVRRAALGLGLPEPWIARLSGRGYGDAGRGIGARPLPSTSPLFLGANLGGAPPAELEPAAAAGALREHLRAIQVLLGLPDDAGLTRRHLEAVAADVELPLDLRAAARTFVERPELLARIGGAAETLGAEQLDRALPALFLDASGLAGDHEVQFKRWALAQVEANAHIRQVYRAVIEMMERDDRPTTVADLLERTRAAAEATVAQDPLFPADPLAGQHLVALTTLVALAGHALQSNHGEVTCLFPRYIPDGRPNDAGFDRAWHFVNQAMFAYVTLFDRRYGRGEIADEFERAVEQTDQWGAAAHVSAAYDRLRGACGAYVPGALPGPPGVPTIHFAPPEGLSVEQQKAYDLAIRVGDAHEYVPELGDPAAIGTNFPILDPLAEIDSTWDVLSTLKDPGSSRDLSANRAGAGEGVRAFEDPSAFHRPPFDDGAHVEGQTFAPGRPVPFAHYLGQELFLFDRMACPDLDPAAFAAAVTEVERSGAEKALRQVVERIVDLVDSSYAADRDRVARYYAGFAVRHFQYGWRIEGLDGEEKRWRPHHGFASDPGVPKGRVKEHLLRRLAAVARAFNPPLHLEVPDQAALEPDGAGAGLPITRP